MRCSSCGRDNPDGLKFCNQCGAPFRVQCSKCGFDNAPGARFCGECGASLSASEPTRPVAAPARSEDGSRSQAGERRHLTLLFCDLVGSTELAARLDPEEYQQTLAGYHRAAAEAIGRFGGNVAKYLGDGVMAYFGYPAAHDNDAERAVRAGIGILEAISGLNQQSPAIPRPFPPVQLSVRIGIDSGAVVVGAGASTEFDIFGEAPNIAARVQAAAAPDTVLITAATHRLVTGLFVVEDCGAQSLKGIEQPILLYRVVRAAGVRGRLAAAAASRGLTAFIGREDEMRTLTSRWQRVLDGEGQVVLIVGEAGIGKSRLVQQFRQQISGTPHTTIEAAAAPFYQNTPFYAVADLLRQLIWKQAFDRLNDYLRELQDKSDAQTAARSPSRSLASNSADETAVPSSNSLSPPPFSDTGEGQGGGAGGGADARLIELQSGLARAGLKPAEAIPLIAPLLHLPLSATYSSSSLAPEEQRRRLLATLIEWLLGAARTEPLLVVIEDLHWADPSTLELLQLLMEQGAVAPLLLLCTARPEFHPEWPLRAHHMQITLNRLSATNVREMIAQVAAANALARETLDAVVERTSGVPLFVEELTRAVLEGGDGNIAGREIPVTLHDSLMARLDRLGSAKEVLQIGSVIGGEFSYEILDAVHPLGDNVLQRELRRLTDADLLYARGLPPDATYQFKHALIRDTAYEALLKSRRRELHRLVARTIDEKFPDIKEARPEVLARHWTEAGEAELAISQWMKAAQAAEARNAFYEAQESCQQALALLDLIPESPERDNIPESPERDNRELQLRQSLVSMLQVTRGWAAPETVAAAARVRTLTEKRGDLGQVIASVTGRCFHAYIAGDLIVARGLAEQALQLALREMNPTALALLHMMQLFICFQRGDLAGAEKHFATGLEFFDDRGFRQNPNGGAIATFGLASHNAWTLGRADTARARIAKMMAAVNPANPHDLPWAEFYAASLHSVMRESEQAAELAARVLDACEKHKFPNEAAFARAVVGLERAHLGRTTEGIALLREAIADLLKVGNRIGVIFFINNLAEVQNLEGAIAEALATVEQALQFNPEQRVQRPETLRLRGELHRANGQADLAQADFRDSISLAQSMSAKAWELRATMSLARLLEQQGRRVEARSMLAAIYDWFTEGFDTPDLKDAKALLDALSA